MVWCWLPHIGNRIADFYRELELCPGVRFRGVLEIYIRFACDLIGELFAKLRSVHSDIDDAGFVEPKYHPSLQGGSRVVQVDYRLLGPFYRLKGALNQLFT